VSPLVGCPRGGAQPRHMWYTIRMSDAKGLPSRIDLEHVLDSMRGVYFDYTNRGIQLLDLLTREPLNPNVPPPSVLQSELQKDGFAYLRTFARLGRTVPLILNNHNGASDVVDLVEQHGHLLLPAHTVAIETGWRRPKGKGLSDVEFVLSPNPRQAVFQQALHDWLAANKKRALPCKYSVRDDLTVAMERANELYLAVTANEGGVLDERKRNCARLILDCSLQYSRQWLILGQYGYWHLEAGLVAPAPLILGKWHRPSELRLRNYIGAPVAVHTTHHASRLPAYGNTFVRVMATAAATYAQLDVTVE